MKKSEVVKENNRIFGVHIPCKGCGATTFAYNLIDEKFCKYENWILVCDNRFCRFYTWAVRIEGYSDGSNRLEWIPFDDEESYEAIIRFEVRIKMDVEFPTRLWIENRKQDITQKIIEATYVKDVLDAEYFGECSDE